MRRLWCHAPSRVAQVVTPSPVSAIHLSIGGLMDKVNVGLQLAQFSECWSPRIVGELMGSR